MGHLQKYFTGFAGSIFTAIGVKKSNYTATNPVTFFLHSVLTNSTKMRTHRNQLIHLIFFLLVMLLSPFVRLYAQTQNSDFDRIKLTEVNKIFSGLALSPDGKTLAVSTKKNEPIKLFDLESQQLISSIEAGKWYAGSRINYSSKGSYLLAQELMFYDLIENKRRKYNFELIDVSTGTIVKSFDDVQEVMVSNDEQSVACLSQGVITLYALQGGASEKAIRVEDAADAFALSPDGKTLVVSHLVSAAMLKADPRFKKNKKAAKMALKYQQQISFYDVESGKRLKTLNDLYDIIYRLRWSDDGAHVYVFQLPHLKVMTSKQLMATVNMVDAASMTSIRRGLTSQAIGHPDIRLSHDGKWFAINSKGRKYQEIHLYDYASGNLEKRFELGQRLFQKGDDGERLLQDERPSFVFLPDNQSILIAMGNQLVVWNIFEDQ